MVSSSQFRVVAIRPYLDNIRKPVTEALHGLGGILAADDVLPDGAGDREAEALLVRRGLPRVLLVPFHMSKDDQGKPQHGLSTLAHLAQALPLTAQIPVLMPVSRFGAPGLALQGDRWNESARVSRILVIHEDELRPAAALQARVAAFLQPHGVGKAA